MHTLKSLITALVLLVATLSAQNLPGLPPLSYGPDTRTGFVQGLGTATPLFAITQGGSAASTSYSYTVVSRDVMNHTRSWTIVTATGAATLNTTDYNIVTVAAFSVTATAIEPVGGCSVYRISGGTTQGLIGTIYPCVNGGVLNDTGLAADGTSVPADTGGVVAAHEIRARLTSPTVCVSAASPAVCAAASSGAITVAASATTKTVNTSAVSTISQILVQQDSSLSTRIGVTCNATVNPWIVTARVPGVSFTLTTTAPVTNPACFSYLIIN